MSRMSDIAGIIKGLERVGESCCKLTSAELRPFVESSYIKPVAQQAFRIITEEGAKPPQKNSLRIEEMIKNVPLVMEGVLMYSRVLAGESMFSEVRPKHHENKAKSELQHRSGSYRLEVDRKVRSLDLLDLDLTNESALRAKLFSKIYIEDKDTPGQNRTADLVLEEVKLSSAAQERRVPANRLTRVAAFGSLGIGLGVGVLAEASRRAVGLKPPSTGAGLDGSLVLSEANAERIVATLCKVRGAALKLGQILSIQDNAVLSPALAAIFDRVRESADFMPVWQLDRVMRGELGEGWESRFASFEKKPFAAASIGQVHRAVLHGGQQVAVKVQYPGVAKSIDSDIRNLMSLMSVLAFLPKGLFIENIAKHMKLELAQECDYKREAECGRRMKENLSIYPEYYIPTVYSELCTDQVLTTEYITGLTIDRCVELPQPTRDFIAESILKLVFRELFLHRFMQTDPNWANFLYNPRTGQIGLLDFGATREFGPQFVNTYYKIIDAAVNNDRENLLKYSREIGFLTGHESRVMKEAHVESVLLLAAPFHNDTTFDFGKQTITHQIQELSGVMLRERLCPPPPEVYSLHRKLSGLFLLAGKLDSRFNCYQIWRDIRSAYRPFPLKED